MLNNFLPCLNNQRKNISSIFEKLWQYIRCKKVKRYLIFELTHCISFTVRCFEQKTSAHLQAVQNVMQNSVKCNSTLGEIRAITC